MEGGSISCGEKHSKAKLSGPAYLHFVNGHEGAAICYLGQAWGSVSSECPSDIKQTFFLKKVMQQKYTQRVTSIYLPN